MFPQNKEYHPRGKKKKESCKLIFPSTVQTVRRERPIFLVPAKISAPPISAPRERKIPKRSSIRTFGSKISPASRETSTTRRVVVAHSAPRRNKIQSTQTARRFATSFPLALFSFAADIPRDQPGEKFRFFVSFRSPPLPLRIQISEIAPTSSSVNNLIRLEMTRGSSDFNLILRLKHRGHNVTKSKIKWIHFELRSSLQPTVS